MLVASHESNRLQFATRRLQQASKSEVKAFANAMGMETGTSIDDLTTEYYSRAQYSLRAVGRFFGANDSLTYEEILADSLLELQSDYKSACNTLNIHYYDRSRAIFTKLPLPQLEEELCQYHNTINMAEQTASTGTVSQIAKAVGVTGLTALAKRVPLGFLPGIAFITPLAAALSVGYVGHRMMSPNYRKLIPATMVLISIGKRIKHQPTRKT
jgi:uncharacterized protein YaaW (UPF0174 family)